VFNVRLVGRINALNNCAVDGSDFSYCSHTCLSAVFFSELGSVSVSEPVLRLLATAVVAAAALALLVSLFQISQ
jgi:hypothetical protein